MSHKKARYYDKEGVIQELSEDSDEEELSFDDSEVLEANNTKKTFHRFDTLPVKKDEDEVVSEKSDDDCEIHHLANSSNQQASKKHISSQGSITRNTPFQKQKSQKSTLRIAGSAGSAEKSSMYSLGTADMASIGSHAKVRIIKGSSLGAGNSSTGMADADLELESDYDQYLKEEEES